jgi:hypothetical protein
VKDIAGIYKGSPIIAEKLYSSDMSRYIEPFNDYEFIDSSDPEYADPWADCNITAKVFLPIQVGIQLEYAIRSAADIFLGKYIPLYTFPEYCSFSESSRFILPPTSCGFASLFCEKAVKEGKGSHLFLVWFQEPKEDLLSVLRKKLLMFTWESGAVDSCSLVAAKKELEDQYIDDIDSDKEIEPTIFGNGYRTLPDLSIMKSVFAVIKQTDLVYQDKRLLWEAKIDRRRQRGEKKKLSYKSFKHKEAEEYDWEKAMEKDIDFSWDVAFSNYFKKIDFGKRGLEV